MRTACSAKGARRSLGSPQSRKAPTLLTATTLRNEHWPTWIFGVCVVAMSRSSESRYTNTFTDSPGASPSGISFPGNRISLPSPASRNMPGPDCLVAVRLLSLPICTGAP